MVAMLTNLRTGISNRIKSAIKYTVLWAMDDLDAIPLGTLPREAPSAPISGCFPAAAPPPWHDVDLGVAPPWSPTMPSPHVGELDEDPDADADLEIDSSGWYGAPRWNWGRPWPHVRRLRRGFRDLYVGIFR